MISQVSIFSFLPFLHSQPRPGSILIVSWPHVTKFSSSFDSQHRCSISHSFALTMSEFSSFLPPPGIVDLNDKQSPVCETPPPFRTDYAFTRAVVDTTGLKNKLLNLSPDMWEDEKHNEGNVKLHRPAHDAWGIKKIVFTFCDDFLLKVFDLPWSQAEEWRMHLLPIYQAIGVDESKVVRCLLASMPPGMSIPVHHDTGYWVKHTHRCHVAIVSRPEVSFFVGPTNDTLRKISFNEVQSFCLSHTLSNALTHELYKSTYNVLPSYTPSNTPYHTCFHSHTIQLNLFLFIQPTHVQPPSGMCCRTQQPSQTRGHQRHDRHLAYSSHLRLSWVTSTHTVCVETRGETESDETVDWFGETWRNASGTALEPLSSKISSPLL